MTGTKKVSSYDPIDREILFVMARVKKPVTATQVAKHLNIHPTTAKKRMMYFASKRLLRAKSRGNRILFIGSDELRSGSY